MAFGARKQVKLLQSSIGQSAERHLESMVRADLRQFSFREMARVSCAVNECVLTLTGRVSSYYLKQMAQRIAFERLQDRVEKDEVKILNELQVEP